MKTSSINIRLGLIAVLCLILGAEACSQPLLGQRGRQRRYNRNGAQYQRQQQYHQNDYQDRYQRHPDYVRQPRQRTYEQKAPHHDGGFLIPSYEAQSERLRSVNMAPRSPYGHTQGYGEVNRVPYSRYPYQHYRGY